MCISDKTGEVEMEDSESENNNDDDEEDENMSDTWLNNKQLCAF